MNELKRLTEFQRALADYHISDAGKKLLSDVRLVLLAAPTSSGRNTIIRELMKRDSYHYIISDTTRKPRTNDGQLEQNGVQYWFRSEDEVLSDLREGKFLEAAIIHNQQVSGISLRELELARQEHKVAITDIEMVGVHNILAAKPDTTVIFVSPPNFEEWQRRLLRRGDMDPAEYMRRLNSSLHEFKHALEQPYYHFVVNDDLLTAVEQIDALATTNGLQPTVEQHNREIVRELCRATERYLRNRQ